MNRAVDRRRIFYTRGDYTAFMHVLQEGTSFSWADVLGYTVMPNHWHLVLRAITDTGISRFVQRLTTTHVLRYRRFHGTTGLGHLYHGRFRALPIEGDVHFLTVLRYVEANAWTASLVERAEDWEWSSAFERDRCHRGIIAALPVALPPHWYRLLNQEPGMGPTDWGA